MTFSFYLFLLVVMAAFGLPIYLRRRERARLRAEEEAKEAAERKEAAKAAAQAEAVRLVAQYEDRIRGRGMF